MTRKKFQNLSLKFDKNKASQTFNHEGFIAGIAPNLRGLTLPCMLKSLGRLDSRLGFLLQKRVIHFTEET